MTYLPRRMIFHLLVSLERGGPNNPLSGPQGSQPEGEPPHTKTLESAVFETISSPGTSISLHL